nr:Chain C, 15-mer peptide fragment of Regulatory protein MIG1 [synthetic construct]1T5W_F Chain F, 15-mer peptide fragment of Regulatory protein MIG1 [synthetic construct]1T5X_C Chain C, 15-mer peptide fragment of Regulatory protein MIG1 [synthetic construct]
AAYSDQATPLLLSPR